MLSKKVMFSSILVTLLFVLTVVNTEIEQISKSTGASVVEKQEVILEPEEKVIVKVKTPIKKKSSIKKYVPVVEEEELSEEEITKKLKDALSSDFIKPDERDDFFTKKITSEEFNSQMPTDEELQNMTLDELYNSVHREVYSSIIEEGRWPGQLDIDSDEYKALFKKYTRNYSIENIENATYTIRDDGFIPSYVEPLDDDNIFIGAMKGSVYNKFHLGIEGDIEYNSSDLLPVIEDALSDYDFSYNIFPNSKGGVYRFELEINSLGKTAEEVENVKSKLSNLGLSGLYVGSSEEILLPEYNNDMYREIDDQANLF